jgi:hypothetical protein
MDIFNIEKRIIPLELLKEDYKHISIVCAALIAESEYLKGLPKCFLSFLAFHCFIVSLSNQKVLLPRFIKFLLY